MLICTSINSFSVTISARLSANCMNKEVLYLNLQDAEFETRIVAQGYLYLDRVLRHAQRRIAGCFNSQSKSSLQDQEIVGRIHALFCYSSATSSPVAIVPPFAIVAYAPRFCAASRTIVRSTDGSFFIPG